MKNLSVATSCDFFLSSNSVILDICLKASLLESQNDVRIKQNTSSSCLEIVSGNSSQNVGS